MSTANICIAAVGLSHFHQQRRRGWQALAWVMIVPFLLTLVGCSDFWSGVERNRQMWTAYRYSPAYYERTYSSVVHTPSGSTTCTTTYSTLYRTSETNCY